MRSASLLIFVLAAVSTPIHGAPLKVTTCDRYPTLCRLPEGTGPVIYRDYDDSESGALVVPWKSIGKVASKVLPAVASFAPTVLGWFHQ